MLARASCPALRPFVVRVWASDAPASRVTLERVLPTGCMHVVVRLSSEPLVLVADEAGRDARVIGTTVVGGARSRAYLRRLSGASSSVGAMIAPGAFGALFGVPARALAEAHHDLEDVIGPEARSLRDRLGEERSLARRLALFEAWLLARVRTGVDPRVTTAMRHTRDPVSAWVERAGQSHKSFLRVFHEAVGLSPKTFQRVTRAQRALSLLRSPNALSEVALDAGYSDQAHMTRELRAITGLPPTALRGGENHVQIPSRPGDEKAPQSGR